LFAGLDSDVTLKNLQDGVFEDDDVDDWDDNPINRKIKFKNYLNYEKAWKSLQK